VRSGESGRHRETRRGAATVHVVSGPLALIWLSAVPGPGRLFEQVVVAQPAGCMQRCLTMATAEGSSKGSRRTARDPASKKSCRQERHGGSAPCCAARKKSGKPLLGGSESAGHWLRSERHSPQGHSRPIHGRALADREANCSPVRGVPPNRAPALLSVSIRLMGGQLVRGPLF